MDRPKEYRGILMNYKIQNLLFPNAEVCDEERLYYRIKGNVENFGDELRFAKNASCNFSTYFNSFSLNKWLEYTKIENLSLHIDVKGTFLIKVYSAYLFCDKPIINCQKSIVVQATEREEYIIPIVMTEGDNIFFSIAALEEDSILYNGGYFTEIDEKELNDVHIDLVMCTFKREKYIKRNIDLLIHQFFERPSYNGADCFTIRVVDNGQTLSPADIEIPGKVILYSNPNVGGSGGFCRGMIESLHSGTATHILFMDDDVLVQVEAFERTYNLLALQKDDVKDSFLGGAMFRLDQKNIQHENLAGFKGNHLISLKQGLNLNRFRDVLLNEKKEIVTNKYAGWWYCCMPASMVSLNNLPFPFFIRMDDIEYSVRNTKKVISLNGISVWHEAFDKKYSALMENYFMFRNNLVVNMVDNTGNKKMDLKFFLVRFIREIFRYDYCGAELLLDGVEAFLMGPDFYKNVDTVKDLKAHGVKQVKSVPLESIANRDLLYGDFKYALKNVKGGIISKIVRYITLNGHFLPSCFFSESGFGEYGYGTDSRLFFLKKRVFACNRNFDQVTVLDIDRKRCFKLIIRWMKLMWRMARNYNKLKKLYVDQFPKMTDEKFWINYLEKQLRD